MGKAIPEKTATILKLWEFNVKFTNFDLIAPPEAATDFEYVSA